MAYATMIPMKFTNKKTTRCMYQYFLKCALILSFFEGGAGLGGICVRTRSCVSFSQKPILPAKGRKDRDYVYSKQIVMGISHTQNAND